jgi:cyanate lyase
MKVMSMTPLTNEDYLKRVQFEDELKAVNAAVKAKGYTYQKLAADLGTNKVWLTSALMGQQYVPIEYTEKLADLLGISKDETAFLSNHPYKGNTDPILYRLHEVLDTYGSALKELIHEKGGNGIMSAIDFTIDMDIIPDDHGDRVVIIWNGKLLKYSDKGNYPW